MRAIRPPHDNEKLTLERCRDEQCHQPDLERYRLLGVRYRPTVLIRRSLTEFSGTWHETRTVNATASIQFKGTDVYVYGVRGPRMGSFAFSVDGAVQTISAHAAQDEYRQRIATANNLPYGTHLITLTNLGPLNAGEGTSLLLDYADITVVAGAAGATLTNTTYDDLNPALRYTGDWRNNTNEVFIGVRPASRAAAAASPAVAGHDHVH